MLYAILVAILLIADQWVKYWTTINIVVDTGEAALIPGVVKLVNVHNSGCAFGFMNSLPYVRWIFVGIALVFVVAILFVMIRKVFPSKFATVCCAVAMAGAIGNCIDRFVYGYVVDMFKLEFVNFAVFNVADIFLTVACVLFIIYLIFGYKDKDEDDDEDEEYEAGFDSFTPAKPVDEDIDLSEIESIMIEEQDPAKPVSIDSAFWFSENEKDKKPSAKQDTPAEKKPEPAPKPQPKKVPVSDFDFDAILNEKKPAPEKALTHSDEYSLESILEEFK